MTEGNQWKVEEVSASQFVGQLFELSASSLLSARRRFAKRGMACPDEGPYRVCYDAEFFGKHRSEFVSN
jgi:hypothetical protein